MDDTGISLYYNMRPLIKQADLIEWRANSFIGWAIRRKTGKTVNHTSVSLMYQMVGGTSIRRYVGEAVANGFHLNLLSEDLKGYDGEVWLSRLKDRYDEHRPRIAAAMVDLEGRGYGYFSLLKNLRGPVKFDDGRVFCSEALHIALVRCGLIDEDFNNGMALVPGEFQRTGLYRMPIRIY